MRTMPLVAILALASTCLFAQVGEEAAETHVFPNDAFQAQMAERMEKLFDREKRRDSWAAFAEESISEQLVALDHSQVGQFRVACKSSICRIDMNAVSDDQLLAFVSEVEAALTMISFSRPLGLTRRDSMIRFYSTWTPMSPRELIVS